MIVDGEAATTAIVSCMAQEKHYPEIVRVVAYGLGRNEGQLKLMADRYLAGLCTAAKELWELNRWVQTKSDLELNVVHFALSDLDWLVPFIEGLSNAKEVGLRRQSIALETGVNEAHYFSLIFNMCSPDTRKRMQAANDYVQQFLDARSRETGEAVQDELPFWKGL